MRALRIILQLIFGLLSTMIIFIFLRDPGGDYASNLSMLVLFILIILVLGPWWPSQDNISRWAQNSKLRLPTDDPEVAIYVVNFLGAAYSLYKAWDIYINPVKDLWGFEKTAFAIAGTNGVIASWLILAFGCLSYGVSTYVRAKKA